MADKSKHPNETEPEPFVDPAGEDQDEVNGIEGQIVYPDAEVDAERAGEFAAGKVDTLYEDEEQKTDREKIQDDIDNYSRDEDDEESTRASKKESKK